MGKSKYYTVPEFAALAGVTKQAVYDRIKKDLGGLTTKQGGKTLISEEALCMVGSGAVVRDENGQSSNKAVSKDVGQSSNQVKIEIDCLNQGDKQSSNQAINQASEPSSEVNQETSGTLQNNREDCRKESNGVKFGGQKVNQDSQEEHSFLEYLIKENARLIAESERKDAVIAEKDRELHTYYERVMGLTEQLASLAEREQDIASKALSTTGQAQLLHAMSGDQSEVVTMVQGNALPDETPPEKHKKSPWWKRKGK